MSYTKFQQMYIDCVEGEAHQSAIEIIGELERSTLVRDFPCPKCKEKSVHAHYMSIDKVVLKCDSCYVLFFGSLEKYGK